jgi:hypothetical protein
MTLHAAIEQLLRQAGRPMTTQEIAEALNHNKWYQKKDGSQIDAFQIHGRTRNYPDLFNRDGVVVSLAGHRAIESSAVQRSSSKSNKDETYVLDICDKVLGLQSIRQHRFDFLAGDVNENGRAKPLPVDAYYPEINLVIEYRERQHTESVAFFDKADKLTISGVHRGQQRRIYDERRREVLPQHGIQLIEIAYSYFNHNRQKRIVRDSNHDEEVIRTRLKDFIGK